MREIENQIQGSCCSEIVGGPNFSLLSFPCNMDIDLTMFSFWLTALVVVSGPFIKPVVGVLEDRKQILSRKFGPKASFNLYSCCIFGYSVITYVCYLQTLRFQHNSHKLQTNQVLLFGYILLVAGLTLKVFTYVSYGWNIVVGDYYFHQHGVKGKEGSASRPENDPYYHPSGTSSILVMTALSFIMASETGLLLCLILGLSYVCAYQLEQFLLGIPKINFLSETCLLKIGLGGLKIGLDGIRTIHGVINAVKGKKERDSDIDG